MNNSALDKGLVSAFDRHGGSSLQLPDSDLDVRARSARNGATKEASMRSAKLLCAYMRKGVEITGCLALLSVLAIGANTSYKVQQINPKGSTKTYAIALNKSSAVVGNYTDSSGVVHGFKFAGNRYTIVDFPHANKFSRANGINDTNLIVGDFFGTDNFFHGFTLSGGTYKQYDINLGSASTSIFGVNNAGDFVGQPERAVPTRASSISAA